MNDHERLMRLEKQVRRYRNTTALLVMATAAVLFSGAGESVPEVIRARSIEVIDPAGRPLVALREGQCRPRYYRRPLPRSLWARHRA